MDNLSVLDLINLPEELEPETIYLLHPELSPMEVQKVQVLKAIKSTNFIHEDMDVFENAVHVLNGINPDVTKMEGCKPEWIVKAIRTIQMISNKPFSFEVKEYVKWNFNEYGYKFYPPELFGEGEENKLYKTVKQLAEKGPFPLKEDYLGIQASKYLKLLEYTKELK